MDEHRSSSNVQSKLLPKTAGSDQRVSKVPVHPVHASKASRKGRPNVKKQSNAPKTLSAPVSIWGLCLMFNLVFLSMLTIPFVLLGLVTWEPVHFKSNGTSRLPVYNAAPPTGHYYTGVSPAKFALVSSWASTLVGNISSPFLILFSFLIARSLIPKAGSDGAFRVADDRHNMDQEHRVRELLHSRTYKKVWNWMKNSFLWGSHRSTVSGGICVAIVGVGFTLLFSVLIIAGDTWLHFAVQQATYRYYADPDYPVFNASADSTDPDNPLFPYAAGYAPTQDCEAFLNGTSDLPCSLENSTYFNMAYPSYAYLVLQTGISSVSDNFTDTNFKDTIRSQAAGFASADQVVTYLDASTNSNHSFLFYLDAAYQYSDESTSNHGYDYVAPTHSMQTTCTSADTLCKLTKDSTLYDCSPIFSGNMSQESTNGHFKIPNWNTAFYKPNAGGYPKALNLSDDQNPFLFNVTVQVDSVSDFLGIDGSNAGNDLPEPLIQTGNGTVAFALSCSASVYNVNYSLVNGSIQTFETELASARLASIVRAPLQAGYGRYNLYQDAITSVLGGSDSNPINGTMARSFSQVAIALSAGAYNYTPNIVQRERWDQTVTSVPVAPVWFLATACALYALVAIIAFVIALVLRRNDVVRETQRRLGLENVNDAMTGTLGQDIDSASEDVVDYDEAEIDSPELDAIVDTISDLGEEEQAGEAREAREKEHEKEKKPGRRRAIHKAL